MALFRAPATPLFYTISMCILIILRNVHGEVINWRRRAELIHPKEVYHE